MKHFLFLFIGLVLNSVSLAQQPASQNTLQQIIGTNFRPVAFANTPLVVRADFNGDGIEDLSVIVQDSNDASQLQIYLGVSDGKYQLHSSYVPHDAEEGEGHGISSFALTINARGTLVYQRADTTIKIRFENEDFRVIGITLEEIPGGSTTEFKRDYNLLTGNFVESYKTVRWFHSGRKTVTPVCNKTQNVPHDFITVNDLSKSDVFDKIDTVSQCKPN